MFELPKLKYSYDALLPHIDAKTMEIHHTKHHAAYISALNDAITGTKSEGKSLEEIIKGENLSPAVRNNGGGHWNHSFFWEILTPNGGSVPSGPFAEELLKVFNNFENFKEEFEKAALARFGSGWVWLVKTQDGLMICSTPNQDNPLMKDVPIHGTPILGLDVWEHAYYLNYQNHRADYVKAFWNVVDWEEVGRRFSEAS